MGIYKIIARSYSEFSKVARYKVNIQKLTVYLSCICSSKTLFTETGDQPAHYSFFLYWDTIDRYHCVSLTFTVYWFDTFIYCNMDYHHSGSYVPLPHHIIIIFLWWYAVKAGCKVSCKNDVLTGNSLVVQWLRIHLPMPGTRVRALVQEDPTCRGATKPMRHNYWSPRTWSPCSATREATAMRSPCTATKSSPRSPQLEEAHTQQWKTQCSRK